MTRVLCAVVVCAFVVCSLMGTILAETGNELLEDCREFVGEGKKGVSSAFCLAYVSGVTDALNNSVARPLYCFPDGVVYTQLARVVTKYLEDHPAELHRIGAGLVKDAFLEASFTGTEKGEGSRQAVGQAACDCGRGQDCCPTRRGLVVVDDHKRTRREQGHSTAGVLQLAQKPPGI